MEPSPKPPPTAYAARRARLARRLREENAVLLLPGGELATRSHDTEYRFRPDSDLHYLTGMCEPGAVMALRPGSGEGDERLTLFVRERDRDAEIWSGRRIGPEGARALHGASESHAIGELARLLPELLDGVQRLYVPLVGARALSRSVTTALTQLRSRNRVGKMPPLLLGDARALVGEDRIRKDSAALASLRRAIELSARAHREAMTTVRPGMYEYELEATVEFAFRRAGSSGPGYGTIVAGGPNATILHYVDNRDPLEAGRLVLIDAGAEWDYFSGDITRTFPVSGTFSAEQRHVYEIVLAANLEGIARSVIGADIDSIHAACLRILAVGLRDLGVLSASVDEIVEKELFKPYYPHRTSHWLGLDVHDAGWYTFERKPRPLEASFVLTVEPGLYFQPDDTSVPEALRGLGVRIEDDVLISPQGPEVLSSGVPKSIADIEALMDGGAAGRAPAPPG